MVIGRNSFWASLGTSERKASSAFVFVLTQWTDQFADEGEGFDPSLWSNGRSVDLSETAGAAGNAQA